MLIGKFIGILSEDGINLRRKSKMQQINIRRIWLIGIRQLKLVGKYI
jgi:hypothetical protein